MKEHDTLWDILKDDWTGREYRFVGGSRMHVTLDAVDMIQFGFVQNDRYRSFWMQKSDLQNDIDNGDMVRVK